jgi:hypothetical protein
MLEYDNHRGFRCQRCSNWTLGGNLYSGNDGIRICFLCHMEEVSSEMARRYSVLGDPDLIPDLYGRDMGPSIPLENEDVPVMIQDPIRRKYQGNTYAGHL